MLTKKCDYCGNEFEYLKGQKGRRFCSRECFHKKHSEEQRGENHPNWVPKITKKCIICGKEIKVREKLLKRTKVCSLECRYKLQRRKPPEEHPNWKGGRETNYLGYIRIMAKDHPRAHRGKVFEHILVMEKHLGRFLIKGEVVHHINRNTKDNRIENLRLFENNKKHLEYHRRVKNDKDNV